VSNEDNEDQGSGEVEVLQGKVTELEASAAASASELSRLQGDPDVAAVLAAKAAHQPLRMTIGEPEPQEEDVTIPDASELDSMTNTQVVALMQRVLPKAVASQTRELTDEVAALKAELAGTRKEKLTTQVELLNQKYPDLAEHKATILALAPQGLSIEEAYLVSRVRSGKGLPVEKPRVQETPTERPSSVTFRPAEKPTPAKQGSRGFKADLEEALDRIDFKA
jgi:hypothetical protein